MSRARLQEVFGARVGSQPRVPAQHAWPNSHPPHPQRKPRGNSALFYGTEEREPQPGLSSIRLPDQS